MKQWWNELLCSLFGHREEWGAWTITPETDILGFHYTGDPVTFHRRCKRCGIYLKGLSD